jgi:anti-sigma-K factor RskA
MSTSEPITTKWDLALDGISHLKGQIDAMLQTQRDMQDQINDLRHSYTRTAPMSSAMLLEARVTALETGATAQILAHLKSEALERQARQAQRDRIDRWRAIALAVLAVAVVGLTVAVIWAGLQL